MFWIKKKGWKTGFWVKRALTLIFKPPRWPKSGQNRWCVDYLSFFLNAHIKKKGLVAWACPDEPARGPWLYGLGRLACLLKPNNVWPFFSLIVLFMFFFFKKNLITFILIPLLSFILFRGPLLNNIDILIMRLIFEEFFMIHLWFCFYLLYR